MDWTSGAKHLGGKDEPKKEIKEIRTRKSSNGGHIHEHHFHHSEVHPSEEHTTQGDDGMAEHMLQNMGTPNPGEAEADAGQSGIPGESASASPASPTGATSAMQAAIGG